jgi:nucleolar protein 15
MPGPSKDKVSRKPKATRIPPTSARKAARVEKAVVVPKAKPAPVVEAESEESEDDGVQVFFPDADEGLGSEQEEVIAVGAGSDGEGDAEDAALLTALGGNSSSDGAGSSDDEEDAEAEDAEGADATSHRLDAFKANLPKVLLDPEERAAQLRTKRKQQRPTEEPGVVFLGRIPHGFYEKEMTSYFSQFGRVQRIRLSRNRKTGRSKHFAFLEFASATVAKVVADTMDNYLLFNHLLQCKVVEADKLHPRTFVGCERKFKAIPWNKVERTRHNRVCARCVCVCVCVCAPLHPLIHTPPSYPPAPHRQVKSPESRQKNVDRLLRKEGTKRAKLAALGIAYDFPGYQGAAAATATLSE